jgi:AcrR family transcriptional regulator
MTTASRSVRKDVTRNRALLLRAANEVFAQRGSDATLDDIARHAGVGVATAYRHFENKRALLEALFENRLTHILEIMQAAEAIADPRESFEALIYGVVELQARDRGMREAVGAHPDLHRGARVGERLTPLLQRVFERARQADVLRPEIELADVAMIFVMMGAVSDRAGLENPELWRRYLALLLDGMSAASMPAHAVVVAALTTEQTEAAMSRWQASR